MSNSLQPTDWSIPGFPVHHQHPEFTQIHVIESVMTSGNLIFCHPLPPSSIFPIRVFTNESVLHIKWPKYWSFSISPSNDYSGLISFRIDWFYLLEVQGTLKSLFQNHSLLKFMSIESVMLTSHLILCRLSPLVFNLSQHQGLFQWVSSYCQVVKVLEFQF